MFSFIHMQIESNSCELNKCETEGCRLEMAKTKSKEALYEFLLCKFLMFNVKVSTSSCMCVIVLLCSHLDYFSWHLF